ncbi:endonuclease/exonuclease/phosphatase family protein [Motilimonas sp. KMU-193]|uniref:endonuclease/exonuclease/phosphatase family protein n=1 Tax=Motilimonas sp. KMU-193 TaxID=3388668 RepID=UPI00396B4719
MPLTLMTLNLFNFVAPPCAAYEIDNILDAQQWQSKQAWITEVIQAAQPDVVGFQEVFSATELAQLCSELGYPYFLFTPASGDLSSHVFDKPGLALASKYPLDKKSLHTNIPANVFSREPLIAELTVAGFGALRLYVVHLKSKRALLARDYAAQASELEHYMGRWASDQLRGQEMSLLMQDILLHRQQQKQGVVVFGDFNDDLSQGALPLAFIKPMPKVAGSEQDWSMHDSYTLYATTDERRPTHYYGVHGRILDYILLSGEFAPNYSQQIGLVTGYQCLDRHLTHADFAKHNQASDHAAVVVKLTSLYG